MHWRAQVLEQSAEWKRSFSGKGEPDSPGTQLFVLETNTKDRHQFVTNTGVRPGKKFPFESSPDIRNFWHDDRKASLISALQEIRMKRFSNNTFINGIFENAKYNLRN